MRKLTIGSYEAGQVELISDGDGTVVKVHWPADRELDEWMDVLVRLTRSAELDIAMSGGDFAVGTSTDGLSASAQKDGRLLLRCTGANSLGPIHAEFFLSPAESAQLRDHFSAIISER